jgi:hypothetical protein
MAYGKSGLLHLQDGDRQGRVWLKEGLVVHAELGDVDGEDAFYDLALWKSGTFSFQVGEAAPKETINKSGTNLLIEATRRLDEWNMISSKIPSFDVFPTRVQLSGAKSIRLTREDWKILLFMDGQTTIRQIAETSGQDLFETGRVVFNLITVGVVSIEREAAAKEEQYNQVPSLEPDLAAEEFKMNAEQWRLISQIDGQRSVGALASQLGIPAPTLEKVLNQLAEKGFVRMGGAAPKGGKSRNVAETKKEDPAQVEQEVATARPRIRAVGLD